MSKKNVSILDDAFIDEYVESSGMLVQIRSNGTRKVSLSFVNDPGLTEQSHGDQTSIQFILDQYIRAGQKVVMPESEFQNLLDIPSYQDALNVVHTIEDTFMNLPLKVREAYGHDPKLFMSAIENPEERTKLEGLGILEPLRIEIPASDDMVKDQPAKPQVSP